MNDYARIARVIHYLDTHHHEQPDLESVAEIIGLSPFHFHRLFKRWAGVTPKAFIQCLTIAEAKRALQDGQSVLDSAIDAGLSGPSRLHDLCLKLEAATPGEIKSGGDGLNLDYGVGDTPFGHLLVAASPRGLCHLAFVETDERDALANLQKAWPKATIRQNEGLAETWLERIFGHEKKGSQTPITAHVRGTAFQLKVWRALLAIPSGSLCSYGQLASSIQQPSAARAVGTAVAANPLAFLIPCHRVIRETGIIGNYRWGHGRKRTLIAWERALESPPV